MVWVALGLGSNHEPEANLASALDELLLQFHDLALSWVFRSKAQDASAPDYLNMTVGIDTDLPLQELAKLLKKIEDKHRRERGSARVTLDIDLLLYGDKCGNFDGIVLPRAEILTAAHVLRPLTQIAGKKKHPALKQSYRELWEAFDQARQPLVPVNFSWHGRTLSRA